MQAQSLTMFAGIISVNGRDWSVATDSLVETCRELVTDLADTLNSVSNETLREDRLGFEDEESALDSLHEVIAFYRRQGQEVVVHLLQVTFKLDGELLAFNLDLI